MGWLGRYIHNGLYWLDCGINWVFGGDPRETVSSRAGKAARNGRLWGCILCRFLSFILRRNHCERSINPSLGSKAIIKDGQ